MPRKARISTAIRSTARTGNRAGSEPPSKGAGPSRRTLSLPPPRNNPLAPLAHRISVMPCHDKSWQGMTDIRCARGARGLFRGGGNDKVRREGPAPFDGGSDPARLPVRAVDRIAVLILAFLGIAYALEGYFHP